MDYKSIPQIELSYHSKAGAKLPIINEPEAAYEVLKASWDENKIELLEQFKIILLDKRSQCLGIVNIATGGIDSCTVDARLIFAAALKARATRIILAHNHPSGNLKFSRNDILLTERMVQIGKIMNIAIDDHHILTANGYASMAGEGLMPSVL